MFELLSVQQVLTELFAQIHIYLTEGALSFDEVVEMLIDELPFLVFVSTHLFKVGEEIHFLLGLIQEIELFIDERPISSGMYHSVRSESTSYLAKAASICFLL